MGATEAQQKAIARVEVQDAGATKSRGTAFLAFTGGLMLTAAHVVFDVDAPNRPRRAGKILLFFDTRSAAPPPFVEAAILDHDVDADWALLRATPPAGTTPIFLTTTPPELGAAWTTFGFPQGGDIRGGGYDGTVKNRYEPHLELDSTGANAAPAGAGAQGLSGAPCIVGDAAVGVIVARPNSGKILAVRADRILAKRPDLQRAPLPFEALIAGRLAKIPAAELEDLARRLELTDDDIASPNLAARVARSMFACPPFELAKIVGARAAHSEALKSGAPYLLQLIETLWVKADAANELGRFVLAAEPKVAAVNTAELRAGCHYVARASEAERRFGEWPICRLQPSEEHATPEALLGAVRDALRAKLYAPGARPSDAQLANTVARKKPVVVLLYDPAALTDLAASLEDALPGLRVVVLTGGALSAESAATRAGVAYITPEIQPADETSYEYARDECDDMRRELGLPPSEYA